eukprot:g18902.t1
MAKLLLEKGARAEGLSLRVAQKLREVGADASLLLPCFVRHASLADVRECIDGGRLDINAEIRLGHTTTRVISTFRDRIDSVIELMGEGARCEGLAIGGSSALQDFSRDRQNVHTSLTNKALCRNVQAAYEILEGFSLKESRTLLELETELENKNIPDSFWQQAQEANKSSCSGRGLAEVRSAAMLTDIAGWKKMLQKTISTAEHHALFAEVQARLLEICDRAKLQEVYDRIIDGDRATYYTNKLRGLLFRTLTEEFGDDLAKLRAEEERDDTQLWGLIQELGDVAEIFTQACADHMVEVVDPVSVSPPMPTASTCSTATIMGASTCSTAMPGGGIGTAVAGTAADVAVTSSTASSTGGGKTAASIITNAAAGAANTGVAGTGSSSSSSGSGTVGPNKTGQDNGGSTTTPTASGSGAPPTEHPGEGAVGKKSYAWQHVNQFRKHKGPAPVSVQLQQIRDRQKQQRQIELETRVKQFEKNSGFHLTNRCLTQEKFDACMRNKTKVELRELKRLVCTASNEYKDPFFKDKDVVLIVIAIHFAPQVSLGNGQVCSEWKIRGGRICDLPTTVNPQAFVCTLRLQDQAFLGWTENRDAKQEWVKGSVFAVLNPVVTFQQSNHKYFVRVRMSRDQLMIPIFIFRAR